MAESLDLHGAYEVAHAPRTPIEIEPVPPERVIDELDLAESPRTLLNSITGGIWGKINGGRMILEVRNASIIQTPLGGSVNIYDFDDCLMSATGWHAKEYFLLEEDKRLQELGINIESTEAKEIYELSKISVPGFAEKELRYTPRLNLILLSIFADAKKESQKQENDPGQAWEEMKSWRDTIHKQVQKYGERAFKAYRVNPAIQKVFMNNSPSDFLYEEFVRDLLGQTGRKDMRVIASRGKIEGPLGQVYKIHSSGLMRQRSLFGQSIDMAIYTNDIKSDALLSIMNLIPDIGQRHIRIFDDNPNEVLPYLDVISNLGAGNIEVVQVSHPDAKRRDLKVSPAPSVSYKRGDVQLRHYSLLSVQQAPQGLNIPK